jgi:hypothetical protein
MQVVAAYTELDYMVFVIALYSILTVYPAN